jgi:hypothetical protein
MGTEPAELAYFNSPYYVCRTAKSVRRRSPSSATNRKGREGSPGGRRGMSNYVSPGGLLPRGLVPRGLVPRGQRSQRGSPLWVASSRAKLELGFCLTR